VLTYRSVHPNQFKVILTTHRDADERIEALLVPLPVFLTAFDPEKQIRVGFGFESD
jgi:hypothetical protein